MFQKHDRIYLNAPRSIHHGRPATIVNVDPRSKPYAYQVQLDGSEFAFWHPESELSAISIQANPKREEVIPMARKQIAHDFDTGFGIGGINRYQPTAAEEMAQINAQIRHAEWEKKRVRRGPLSNGQLWEPCRCGTEPVCVNCFNCEQHCDC